MTRRDRRPYSVDATCNHIRRRAIQTCNALAAVTSNDAPASPTDVPTTRGKADPTGAAVIAAEAWLHRAARKTADALAELDTAATILQAHIPTLDDHIRWLEGPRTPDTPRPRHGWINTVTAATGRLNVIGTDLDTAAQHVRDAWHRLHQTDRPTDHDHWMLSLSYRAMVDCSTGLARTLRMLTPAEHGLPTCPGCGRVNRARLEGRDRHRTCAACRKAASRQAA